MRFDGKAKRLDDIDLPRIGASIGVGEDELHAVLEVETRGGGFDKNKRPKMLFEPHIFYRELKGKELAAALDRGLAYKKWGEQPYPRDSYPRLKKAMNIHATAALRSCSWGLGQIMGFNFKLAGYATVLEMVKDFRDDEERHLRAMVNFIASNHLDDELRLHDWSGFARGYNGSGFARHGYHTKLEAAFAKWQKIPDTPFKIDRDSVPPGHDNEPPVGAKVGDKRPAATKTRKPAQRAKKAGWRSILAALLRQIADSLEGGIK